MKVFIMCVGTRDPWWDAKQKYIEFDPATNEYTNEADPTSSTEGPIITFFKNIIREGKITEKEEVTIYLLPTSDMPKGIKDPTIRGAIKTKEVLRNILKAYNVKIYELLLYVKDASEPKQLYPQMKLHIDAIIRDTKEKNPEYIINLQPGTPQMSYIFISLTAMGYIPNVKFWEIKESQIRELQIGFIFEEEVVTRGIKLLEEGYFKGASDAFTELLLEPKTVLPENEEKVYLFDALTSAYKDWDFLRYKEAFDGLEKVLNSYSKIAFFDPNNSLKDILQKQKETLINLDPSVSKKDFQKHIQTYISDLYYAALRRIQQDNYADALWRFDALCTIILKEKVHHCIFEHFGFSAREQFKQMINRNKSKKSTKNDKIKLSQIDDLKIEIPESLEDLKREAAMEIIKWLDPEFYDKFIGLPKSNKTISYIRNRRNELLYKMIVPTKEEIEKIQRRVEELLNAYPSTLNLDNHTFTTQRIKEIATLFTEIYKRTTI